MSTIPGLFVLGEANFSDHGANRLGASALMQGLADGYFVLPYTIGDYLAQHEARRRSTTDHARVQGGRGRGRASAPSGCSTIKGKRTVDSFHRELGKLMWEYCGMARNEAGLEAGARRRSPRCARSSGSDVRVPGERRGAQPVAREGRPRRRLPRARRADVPRRARRARSRAAATSARSTRRRTARRSATTRTSATSAPGSTRATARRRSAHKEPLVFENVHLATAELQVSTGKNDEAHAPRLAPEGRPDARAAS